MDKQESKFLILKDVLIVVLKLLSKFFSNFGGSIYINYELMAKLNANMSFIVLLKSFFGEKLDLYFDANKKGIRLKFSISIAALIQLILELIFELAKKGVFRRLICLTKKN